MRSSSVAPSLLRSKVVIFLGAHLIAFAFWFSFKMQPKPEHLELSFCSAAPSTGVDEEFRDADFLLESCVVSLEDSDAASSASEVPFDPSSRRRDSADGSEVPKSDSVSGRIFSMNQERNVW